MLEDHVTIRLSADEALVLFEWIHRIEDSGDEEALVAYPGEQGALTRLSGALESAVASIFDPNYVQLVENARQRLAERYETNATALVNRGYARAIGSATGHFVGPHGSGATFALAATAHGLTWIAVPDRGTDLSDPEIHAWADDVVNELSRQWRHSGGINK